MEKLDVNRFLNAECKIRKRSFFYRFSCWFLKVFLYLIPPYSKNK